ncbi:hypothetical protein Tco_0639418 [Tanacetum coccineum]
MVAYLQNSEGSKEFHQIIDFLNASPIKYAIIKNPMIYVSLIQQFWGTATASTTDDGEVEITARIDGQVKTITEASLRRHLKLEDSDGITSLPNTEIFEQLALMLADKATFTSVDVDAGGAATTDIGLDAGQGSGTIHKTPTRLNDAPLSGVNTPGSAEGSLSQTELMELVIKLLDRVENLEKDLQQTKVTYARRRARIVISDEEEDVKDPSKQWRMIEDIGEDTDITLVNPTKVSSQSDQSEDYLKVLSAAKVLADAARKRREVANIAPYTRRKRAISTASGDISTVEEPVNTVGTGASKPVSTADKVQERIKDKVSKGNSKTGIRKSDPAVLRYHALQNRSFSVAEVRKNMCVYLKNQGGYKQSHFKGMSYEEIRPIFERVWDQNQSFVPMDSKKERESRKKKLARKRVVEGLTIEALQTKYSLTDWEIYTKDSRVYWKIIRVGDHIEISIL